MFGGDAGNYLEGSLQNFFYIDGSTLLADQIAELYEYEAQRMAFWRERVTMVFDEESESWAKWDCSFDALCSAKHSSNCAEVLCAAKGFVYRLNEGESDGAATLSGGPVPTSGSVSALSTATLTDSGAQFPTDGNGLAGCRVLLVSSADNSEQERTILANTATTLYLDRPVSPAVTGTYYIAPIDWYWESPWMDMGDPSIVKRWYLFQVFQAESSDGETVTVKYKTNQSETWVSTSFTTLDEFVRETLNTRGRWIKLRFENRYPMQQVEINAFQTIFEPKEWV